MTKYTALIKKQRMALLFLLVFLLFTLSTVEAKKLKIRSCTLANGETVLMDKPCPRNSITSAYKKPVKNKPIKTTKNNNRHQQSIQPRSTKKRQINPQANDKGQTSLHNPKEALSLNRLLTSVKAPSNWFVQSFSLSKGDVITASPKRLVSPNALKSGATLHRYTNTFKHFRKDAFSVAIDQFHEIRFDEKNELTESEFIAHDRFKVFNVHYKQKRLRQNTLKAVVQFYVDVSNDDLYVVQFIAPIQHWNRMTQIRDFFFQSLVF